MVDGHKETACTTGLLVAIRENHRVKMRRDQADLTHPQLLYSTSVIKVVCEATRAQKLGAAYRPTAAAMAPVTASAFPLVALFLGSTTAFLAPSGRGASTWCGPNARQQHQPARAGLITRRRPHSAVLQMATGDAGDTGDAAEQKAKKLREAAAAMRAQATELEEKQKRERREGADRSFAAFDSNKDGAVGVAELKAGLEGPLKKTFTKQLTTRMGRKPTPEEVSASKTNSSF